MTNILSLPQVPPIQFVLSSDGDWLDSIFFPSDVNNDPLDITSIQFRCHFRRTTDGQIILPMETTNNTIRLFGPGGLITFTLLAAARTSPLPPCTCTGDLFAVADGYQRNLSEGLGSLGLTIRGDTL